MLVARFHRYSGDQNLTSSVTVQYRHAEVAMPTDFV